MNNDLLMIIKEYSSFGCVSVCINENDALESILKHSLSLVFIDLDSKTKICEPFCFFHKLHQYLDDIPAFVAVSSTKKLAYDVIKNNFQDYLLKPLNGLDIRKCLMKYEKERTQQESQKICLRSYSDYQYLNLKEIIYLQADNNTTDIFLREDRKVSAFKSLKYFEEHLPAHFVRVHHSFIINSSHITRINFGKSQIFLDGVTTKVPFSKINRSKVENLKGDFHNFLSLVI